VTRSPHNGDGMMAHSDRTAPGTAEPLRDRVFAGGGEMRARCRALDWATTPLGAVDAWPQSLRTAAATALGAGFPAMLLCGPELVQPYNDAYARLLGAGHPSALGQPTRACWPEAWDVTAPDLRAGRGGGDGHARGRPLPRA
jgi:hypothetical protein